MEIRMHGHTAEILSDSFVLHSVQDALDLMAEVKFDGADLMVLRKEQLPEAFFDLKTRLAGDIIQKFVNYQMRLAIVGDFSEVKSDSLRAFIIESNRQKQCRFVASLEEVL